MRKLRLREVECPRPYSQLESELRWDWYPRFQPLFQNSYDSTDARTS